MGRPRTDKQKILQLLEDYVDPRDISGEKISNVLLDEKVLGLISESLNYQKIYGGGTSIFLSVVMIDGTIYSGDIVQASDRNIPGTTSYMDYLKPENLKLYLETVFNDLRASFRGMNLLGDDAVVLSCISYDPYSITDEMGLRESGMEIANIEAIISSADIAMLYGLTSTIPNSTLVVGTKSSDENDLVNLNILKQKDKDFELRDALEYMMYATSGVPMLELCPQDAETKQAMQKIKDWVKEHYELNKACLDLGGKNFIYEPLSH